MTKLVKGILANLLNTTNGLDGWCTDAYRSTLKGLFFNNKDTFVKAFNSQDYEQIRLVGSYVEFACDSDEATEAVEYLIAIIHLDSLDVREAFIESFKIDLSGTSITEMFYGPPNFGKNPETDAKEYPYILLRFKSMR